MKKPILLLALSLISLLIYAQDAKTLVVHGDTLWYKNLTSLDSTQLNRIVPSIIGQSGKVLSNNGTVYQWIVNSASVAWGGITGTLSDQTDLQTALDGKQASGSYALQATTVNGHALSGNVTVTATDLSLGNVTNTSDANKPVSTAQQTALDLKANLVSPSFTTPNIGSATGSVSGNAGTATALQNARTINGQSFDGTANITIPGSSVTSIPISSITGYSGYSINVQALTSSPTDAQTIYFGNLPKAPVTAQGTSKIYIRQAGTIKRAEIYCFSGTAGTNEAWPIYIRLNNSGDTQIASVSLNTSERVFSNTSLSIAVVSGDYIEIKSINPTWATNPLTCIFGGYVYIE